MIKHFHSLCQLLLVIVVVITSCTANLSNKVDHSNKKGETDSIVLSFKGISIGCPIEQIDSITKNDTTMICVGKYSNFDIPCLFSIHETDTEKPIKTFRTSIIVNGNKEVFGYVQIYTEDSTVSKIVFTSKNLKMYDKILDLYSNHYGEYSKTFKLIFGEGDFSQTGVYWDFKDQRLYIGKITYESEYRHMNSLPIQSLYHVDINRSYQCVEIIYRDMGPAKRYKEKKLKEAQETKKKIQGEKKQKEERLNQQKLKQDI